MPLDNNVQKFSTIEQVQYWLQRKWPIADEARTLALRQIEAAMDCILPVAVARHAFIAASRTAGFVPEARMTQPKPRMQ